MDRRDDDDALLGIYPVRESRDITNIPCVSDDAEKRNIFSMKGLLIPFLVVAGTIRDRTYGTEENWRRNV
jgi:hypothetical protein